MYLFEDDLNPELLIFYPLIMPESTDESDYEIEYEALSHGSDEEWGSYNDAVMARGYETENQNNRITEKSDTNDGAEEIGTSSSSSIPGSSTPSDVLKKTSELGNGPERESDFVDGEMSTEKISSKTEEQGELESDVFHASELDEDGHYSLDDLERLMHEIGNMRDNLRLMPDFQRREMAATLAMKMAGMFGDDSDDEVGL